MRMTTGNVLSFLILATAMAAAPSDGRLQPEAVTRAHVAAKGTKWAVLVAGSSGYENFRHQADVCHAYQILKKNGMKDENIIVFMYDDIANNEENPTPGIIINKPGGGDVYKGVPKDYTGKSVTAANLYAVLLGNKTALRGGSGKVLNSGPNDNVFVFYTDHGSAGLIGMPVGDDVHAKDLIKVLKTMAAKKSFKNMVIYVEACEAGSLFQGLLPNNINIYATTASNPEESSYGYYCPGDDDHPDVSKYGTCLGDLYSISWMEDCDVKDLRSETLKQQYNLVKKRTTLSHVMQYGYTGLISDFLSTYMGEGNRKVSSAIDSVQEAASSLPATSGLVVSQRDADLIYYQHKVKNAPAGSVQSVEAQKRLSAEISKRQKEDSNINFVVKLLLGDAKSSSAFNAVRPAGQALVDDWDCFKSLVNIYQQRCGRLSTYGKKYTGVMANLCNAGVKKEQFDKAALQACSVAP
ncbi:hypothetical protein MLD38_018136 [Melastoma candidum]|uniref:Uncharacterized protein n=1 Tax=Melastoma candidum TaxID=119954 RepID=A0ACB9QU68_9MYRT|nr:hypothetical protein MLD38_018136 [Melastoma candidum]